MPKSSNLVCDNCGFPILGEWCNICAEETSSAAVEAWHKEVAEGVRRVEMTVTEAGIEYA